jgi:hypothetical protein
MRPVIWVDAQPVGKGIWWLSGNGNAFSILFEFDDHLTLFEAPTSEARTKAVIEKARATVPYKPLTEVIVTHHHFDHTGGLRTAVAEGLTVISHKANEEILKEVTARKATLKPDLLTKSGRTLKFRGMDDTLVLKDASLEVRLFRLHDNTHALPDRSLRAARQPAGRRGPYRHGLDPASLGREFSQESRDAQDPLCQRHSGPRPHRDLRGGNGRPRQDGERDQVI